MTRPEQLDLDDVRKLTPEQAKQALAEGRVDDLLGRPNREPQPPPLDAGRVERAAREGWLDTLLERHRNWQPTERERLRAMRPEAVRAALRAGELDALLRGEE